MFTEEENAGIEELAKQAAAMVVVTAKALGKSFDALAESDIPEKAAKAAALAVAAFEKEGFSREESLRLYANFQSSMGTSSK